MEHSDVARAGAGRQELGQPVRDRLNFLRGDFIVLLFAAVIFLGCIVSPPSLMDDSDAVLAQIGRTMLQTGDWVIARLDGVPYLEKPPMGSWLMAVSYRIFGVHDWAARLPLALGAILLAWLTYRYGRWAFGGRAGFYSGLAIATCVGLFLFTRIQIPDALLTLCVCLSFWSFQRAIEPEEPHPRFWSIVLPVSIAVGMLLKGLIAVVFPAGGIFVYLLATRQLFSRTVWRNLHVFTGAVILLAIAAPWHVLATLRMPPYFVFTMHSGPGQYHGFFWFYFMNEHVLRFLNLRYPRDYDTVPRLYFWLFHLLWLFPWSFYFPAIAKLSFKPLDRAGRTRLLALCWAGFILIFFTFSTTQEYYSMPCYPALALLLGSAISAEGKWIRRGTRALGIVTACAAIASIVILVLSWGMPHPGDISAALSRHPKAYKLSLGHMEDLTLASFAYLRLPLALAGVAFVIGCAGTFLKKMQQVALAAALMMALFFHAARLAMVAFDPYMSSRPLAEALLKAPNGELIVDRHYYYFSSVFFYTNRSALLLNGRFMNLEYGSYAPGAPDVFINDPRFRELWLKPERYYLVAGESAMPRLEALVGQEQLHLVKESGGKLLLTNHPIDALAQVTRADPMWIAETRSVQSPASESK